MKKHRNKTKSIISIYKNNGKIYHIIYIIYILSYFGKDVFNEIRNNTTYPPTPAYFYIFLCSA